jgi:hypothetical protein
MDLSFENNQSFALSLNIAQWKPIYPLTACVFHMQIRSMPVKVPPIIYAWSSNPVDNWGNGTITYTDATGLLYLSAPYSDMILLVPGNYEWDLALIFSGFVKILTGGAFVITGGVTYE